MSYLYLVFIATRVRMLCVTVILLSRQYNKLMFSFFFLFFFQAEDGIRDLVRSRGLGDVYKRQPLTGKKKATVPNPLLWLGITPESGTLP